MIESMPSREEIGESVRVRLKEVRKRRGLKMVELAEMTGLTPAAICHFETTSRQPTLPSLCRLAVALGVTSDYLAGRTDIENEPVEQENFKQYREHFFALPPSMRKLLHEQMKGFFKETYSVPNIDSKDLA